jgi:hypothetical protein
VAEEAGCVYALLGMSKETELSQTISIKVEEKEQVAVFPGSGRSICK